MTLSAGNLNASPLIARRGARNLRTARRRVRKKRAPVVRARRKRVRPVRRKRKILRIPTNNLDSRIITPAQMRGAEEAAFAGGITADFLMEEAGHGIARAVSKFFPVPGRCLVFAGKGHNAGDALVAARMLAQAGWEIETRLVF